MESKESNLEEVKTKLTDEQVVHIAKELDDSIKGTELEEIAKLPSNNGKLERSKSEITESGEKVKMMVEVDPNTGEHKILGKAPEIEEEEEESFEDMCKRIENGDFEIEEDKRPVTIDELKNTIKDDKTGNSMLSDIANKTDLTNETIIELLEVVNRKMNKEEFNVYKAFPQQIRDMIDNYMKAGGIVGASNDVKQFRNMISESVLDEVIMNSRTDRLKNDLNTDLENIMNKGAEEISTEVVGYTIERNKAYREYAEKMEDEDKKQKMLEILDSIQEAYDINGLKEFSKKCKVKSIELEKSDRVYNDFLAKYRTTTQNIYDIKLARPILYRNLSEAYKDDNISFKDVDAFLIVFTKYCQNYKPENKVQHAFMYYVLYNIVLLDTNKGEHKDVSDKFMKNIKECIDNIRTRNGYNK